MPVNTLLRLRPSGVWALEHAWALRLYDGQPFWQAVDARVATTPLELAVAVRNGINCLTELYAFSAVHVYGGRVSTLAFKDALKVQQAHKPAFVSDVAAPYFAHVPEICGVDFRDAMVVDMGQTQIKVGLCNDSGVFYTYPRDFLKLPRTGTSSALAARFLARALRDCVYLWPLCKRLLLALPCSISDDWKFGSCTYNFEDDFLQRALALAEVPDDVEVYVINDAELAGVHAQCETPFHGRVLALTIGLGPGAALVEC